MDFSQTEVGLIDTSCESNRPTQKEYFLQLLKRNLPPTRASSVAQVVVVVCIVIGMISLTVKAKTHDQLIANQTRFNAKLLKGLKASFNLQGWFFK